MANTPIPMLVVEKPDCDDVTDKVSNDKLIECMARLQGKIWVEKKILKIFLKFSYF